MTTPGLAAGGGVQHFFGTRHAPTIAALTAEASSSRVGAPVMVVSVKQVHGTEALIIDRPVPATATFSGTWDALVTNQPGVMVTVKTADCVPVLIHDVHHGVVAAVHAGWRGAIAGIVTKTLDLMKREFGSEPMMTRLAIGPSAGPCCYEVDHAVLEPLRQYHPYWQAVVRQCSPSRGLLDLRALIRRQVTAMGVASEQVETVDLCTICTPSRFYSYRRDGVVNGTMVSGIMLIRPPIETAAPIMTAP